MSLFPIKSDQACSSKQDMAQDCSGFPFGFKTSRVILVCILTIPFWNACSAPQEERNAGDIDNTPTQTSTTDSQGMAFFQGSFDEALASAEEQEKLVFVDVYTIWCGPCIVMQETVFPLPEVGDYFNERFVNLKLDMEDEEQNGPEIGTRYKIGVVPTYLILDSGGNELGRALGGASASQFIEMISRVLGDSESTFEEMQARYDSGERSTEFVQQYLMDAIVELAFREIDNQDSASVRAYFEEGEKFKKIADEYFTSRSFEELINEIDARLVMHFHERTARGNELVEFVLEHYEEFLVVSSESAMAQFTLNTTLGAVADAARAGDEKFTTYIEALDTYPLSKAVVHERNRYPDSRLLPERMRYSWETDFLMAKGDWDGLYEVYKRRFERWGENATASHYQWASRELLQSENPEHHKVAAEYGRQAYELDVKDPYIAVGYISALMAIEKSEEAQQVAEEYRSGLSDSEVDKSSLETFNRITSSMFEEESEATSDGESL